MHDIRTRFGHDATLPKMPSAITNCKSFSSDVEDFWGAFSDDAAVQDDFEASTIKPRNTDHLRSRAPVGQQTVASLCPSKYLVKDWAPIFSKDRRFKEDGSWKDCEVDGGDDIGIIVQEDKGSVPSFETLEIEEFCEGANLDDLESGAGCAGHRRLAWLDDRSCHYLLSTPSIREYENPLTATGLYRLLKRRVRDGNWLPVPNSKC
jgi:hypothetical protein